MSSVGEINLIFDPLLVFLKLFCHDGVQQAIVVFSETFDKLYQQPIHLLSDTLSFNRDVSQALLDGLVVVLCRRLPEGASHVSIEF